MSEDIVKLVEFHDKEHHKIYVQFPAVKSTKEDK